MYCEKIPYDSAKEARDDMANFQIDERHTHKPIRAYKCDKCGKYHTTSLDQDKKTRLNINRKNKQSENRKVRTTYVIPKKNEQMLLRAMKKLSNKK